MMGVFDPTRATPRQQRGMSLVEIMVALALGAVITVGIVQMFTANRATYQMNIGQARLQENARFAMDFITDPVRMAGYTGCSSRVQIRNVIQSEDGNVPTQFDMNDAVAGHAATNGGWSPPLSELPDDIDTDGIAEGTDVLILKTVLDQGINFTGQVPDAPATSFIDLPLDCADDDCSGFEPGSVLMASDCSKTTVFMVTQRTPQPNNDPPRLRVGHNTGNTINGMSNNSQRLADGDDGFLADASVFSIGTQYFFVAPATENDDGLSLWRKRGTAAPRELVEGIEGLRVLYGEDTTGDRAPNRYRPIHEVGNRQNIVTIRVTLTANSVDRVRDEGDGLLRRDFTKTIAIRNRM